MLSLPRARVQSLVRQLRSHKLLARPSKRETKIPSKLIHKVTLHKGLLLCETNLWWLRYGSQWVFFLPFPAPGCSHAHGLPGKHLLLWAVVHVLQCGAWFDVSSPSSHVCLPRIVPPSKSHCLSFASRLHFFQKPISTYQLANPSLNWLQPHACCMKHTLFISRANFKKLLLTAKLQLILFDQLKTCCRLYTSFDVNSYYYLSLMHRIWTVTLSAWLTQPNQSSLSKQSNLASW